MFIRERVKKNCGYKKRYIYHYLIESYRNNDGKPRQRNILSLGKLSLEKKYWKILANRIEEIISNQERLIACSPEIERLSQHYASLLIEKQSSQKELQEAQKDYVPDFERIDLNTLTHTLARTIGAEHIAWEMVKRLGFEKIFRDCGIADIDSKVACILIAARMVYPASELGPHEWLQNVSGLYELEGCEPEEISL